MARQLSLHPLRSDRYPQQPSITAIQSEQILQIELHCPALESLTIIIPRPVSIDSLNDCSTADFCPKIRSVRELAMIFVGPNRNLLFQEVAQKIWDLIDSEEDCH
jgi:hypothetical protein